MGATAHKALWLGIVEGDQSGGVTAMKWGMNEEMRWLANTSDGGLSLHSLTEVVSQDGYRTIVRVNQNCELRL